MTLYITYIYPHITVGQVDEAHFEELLDRYPIPDWYSDRVRNRASGTPSSSPSTSSIPVTDIYSNNKSNNRGKSDSRSSSDSSSIKSGNERSNSFKAPPGGKAKGSADGVGKTRNKTTRRFEN